MPDNNPEPRQPGPPKPQALRLADVARILSVSGPSSVTVEMLQVDVADGVPKNPRRDDDSIVDYVRPQRDAEACDPMRFTGCGLPCFCTERWGKWR